MIPSSSLSEFLCSFPLFSSISNRLQSSSNRPEVCNSGLFFSTPSWRLSLRPITCPRTPRLVLRTKETARGIRGRERRRTSFHHGPPWGAVSRGSSWGDEDPALIAVAAPLCFATRLVRLDTRVLVRHSGNWPLAKAPVKPGTPPAWLLATISLSR